VKHLRLLLCTALAVNATTLFLLSGVSPGESNNIGANVLIAPHPVWAVDPLAKWVSFENSGYGGIVEPNTDLNTPTSIFYQDIVLSEGTGVAGSIQVWADDTATVKLDGMVLFASNPVLAMYCAVGPIGCTQPNGGAIHFSAPGLVHRLEFDVYQRGGATFGLMYNGQAASTFSVVPERDTVSIVGIGLAALGLLSTRLRGKNNLYGIYRSGRPGTDSS
jgi:hypothetical protein